MFVVSPPLPQSITGTVQAVLVVLRGEGAPSVRGILLPPKLHVGSQARVSSASRGGGPKFSRYPHLSQRGTWTVEGVLVMLEVFVVSSSPAPKLLVIFGTDLAVL